MCQCSTPTRHTSVAGLHLMYVYHGGTNSLYSTAQCLLLCRPNSSPTNSVYEDESMNKGDLARADMTKNPSYTVAREVVSTSHAFGTEEEEDEVDHTYEVLPFEAYEECQENTKHGAQKAVDAR